MAHMELFRECRLLRCRDSRRNAASENRVRVAPLPLLGVGLIPDESTVLLYVLFAGAALCIVALTVLAVPMCFEQIRRWRANRRVDSAMKARNEAPLDAATAMRAERLIQADGAQKTALGWSPDDVLDSPTDAGSLSAGSVAGKGKTILVADDDPVVVMALSRRLQHCGYQVLRSPDAAHALMGTIKVRPDLVILDVNMPAGNGLAVCEMMSSDPHYAGIPVIIHSVVTDAATRERCQRLGAHYVEKSARSWAKIKTLLDLLLADHGPAAAMPQEEPGLAEPAAEGEEMPENMEPVEAAPSDTAAATMDRGGETVKKTEVEGKAEELAAEPKPMEQRGKTREAQPRAEPPRDFSPMCGSSRVLCIEYPKDRLELVEHQLSALGMSVSRVDDLEQGFWACFTESPHILVIQAAGCSGKVAKLLHNLGTHPVTRTLPVLLIDEDQAVKEGLIPNEINVTVLQYPMDWEELLSELERHLPMFAAKEEERQPEGEAAAHEPAPHITPAADAVDAASFHAKNGTPTTVLCIDDDPVVIRSIAIRLQPYGIRVEGADNGTQGYLQAVAMRPDLILLDLKMPNGAGNYVLLKLKENDSTRNIPVIVLTVETHPGVRRNMVAVGAAGFLTKPVRWPELFAAMAQCIPLPTQLLKDYKLADSLLLSKP